VAHSIALFGGHAASTPQFLSFSLPALVLGFPSAFVRFNLIGSAALNKAMECVAVWAETL
jgi:hypothetical protein